MKTKFVEVWLFLMLVIFGIKTIYFTYTKFMQTEFLISGLAFGVVAIILNIYLKKAK